MGALEARVRELHPYDLPEIIAWPVERGAENYLGWVTAECKADPEGNP
jgi:periplasmic divalent cation tolerance protein